MKKKINIDNEGIPANISPPIANAQFYHIQMMSALKFKANRITYK